MLSNPPIFFLPHSITLARYLSYRKLFELVALLVLLSFDLIDLINLIDLKDSLTGGAVDVLCNRGLLISGAFNVEILPGFDTGCVVVVLQKQHYCELEFKFGCKYNCEFDINPEITLIPIEFCKNAKT